jgi:hypothetical protein
MGQRYFWGVTKRTDNQVTCENTQSIIVFHNSPPDPWQRVTPRNTVVLCTVRGCLLPLPLPLPTLRLEKTPLSVVIHYIHICKSSSSTNWEYAPCSGDKSIHLTLQLKFDFRTHVYPAVLSLHAITLLPFGTKRGKQGGGISLWTRC